MTLQPTRDDLRIAWLTALAICIHVLESALPSPLPGVKPGLANVITIAALLQFGWATAAWIAVLRVLAGSLLVGTFLSPTFLMSLSGAVASLLALGLAAVVSRRVPALRLGAVGYSVLAALAHMLGQFLIARWLLIPHPGLWHLLPPLLTLAWLFGVISGLVVAQMLRHSETASYRNLTP